MKLLSARDNIVVIADEAHRTQYGFMLNSVISRKKGEVVGQENCLWFREIYSRLALPNATLLDLLEHPSRSRTQHTLQSRQLY
jgi:type I restriction enzyme R subunit